jgi:hypothetical protein
MSTTGPAPRRRKWVDAASLDHAHTLFLSRLRADGLDVQPDGIECLEHDVEQNVRELQVRDILSDTILPDNRLHCAHRDGPSRDHPGRYNTVSWHPDRDVVFVSGFLTVDELEAIAWWMRNKKT